jgi:PIN domain nuclease of toxin-antitoxin system
VNLLLDACTFLWIVLEPARLSPGAAQLATDPANTLYLSSVSAWEIAVVYTLGRITLQQPPEVFVPAQRRNHGIDLLPLSEAAALHVPNLPPIHRDPFDRMLICQAIVHDLTLLTPDPLVRQYPHVRTAW